MKDNPLSNIDFNNLLKENFIHIEKCESTNTLLKENAFNLPNLTVIYTGNQLGGRGRRGKTWECRDQKGGAISVLFRDIPQSRFLKLPIEAAVVGAMVCSELTGEDCFIKWPNDIICKGKKLCGILCEGLSSHDENAAIVGFGINLLQTEGEFLNSALPYAGSVKLLTGREITPKETAEAVLKGINLVGNMKFEQLVELYRSLCLTIGKEITVITGEQRYTAAAKDIDEQGQLIVVRDGAEITVNSGIASIRGLDDYS